MIEDLTPSSSVAPLDLSKWRKLPVILIVVGLVVVGLVTLTLSGDKIRQFSYSYLLAYMFFLSICLGGWFLSMVHHLFDASWSVATRRLCEHLACLLGWPMLVLFLPIALHAKKYIYDWMAKLEHPDHALAAKYPLFTFNGCIIAALICFAIWWFFPWRLRYWSLQQDVTGKAECTFKMRVLSCMGIVLFAFTLTLAAIMLIKALMYEWASTMFGVWYFAASIWTTLATVYIITMLMQRTTALRLVVRENTYYMLGSLLFAFTVFWAYISFAQYFIIWNANMPEETFWFVLREKGTWWFIGAIVIIFGHFFLPFLSLLRIDVKMKLTTMLPICLWAWFMHFIDLEFQIMPALPERAGGFLSAGLLMDVACMMVIGGILAIIFLKSVASHPVYPLKDPRIAEAMGVYVPSSSESHSTQHA
jgi:hypothetical protein